MFNDETHCSSNALCCEFAAIDVPLCLLRPTTVWPFNLANDCYRAGYSILDLQLEFYTRAWILR